jgi:hypothetical protein
LEREKMKTAREDEPERRSENLKEEVGELLLYLQSPLTEEQQKSYWGMFEWKLREYLALKYPRR